MALDTEQQKILDNIYYYHCKHFAYIHWLNLRSKFFLGECYHYDFYYFSGERLRQKQSITES